MKTKNIIQRLCLFLFALMLALPAVATNYNREGYEIFRSRDLGTHKTVTTLRKGKVEITFSSCTTSGSSGNGAIYQPAKGSRITVKADDGYAVRWIILRDTEGGKSYRDKDGIKRISSVTSGYQYYFEKEAISNSRISGGNQNNLNDDDNNIVVYQYDASAQSVEIRTHNNRNWDQFKVRDIIVGYVRAPKVRFEKDRYDMYYTSIPSSFFEPYLNFDNHNGDVDYKVDNHDIATVNADGVLKFKRPGTVVLTATCHASKICAKAQCSTTVTTKRDGVTFTSVGLPDVLFSNTPHNLRDYLNNSKTKSGENFDYNDESFSVTSSNNAVLRYDMPYLKFGGTAGEATITFTQKETNFYEAASLSHTIIVMRRDQDGTILIKDANEWKLFCKLVNEKGMTGLNAKLEADIDLGSDIAMVGNDDHKYSGTFDGQNHALTMNWNAGNTKDIAPFKKVKDATIRNLRTKGTITSSSYYLSGLIDEVYGKTTISGCVSNVNLTSSYGNSAGCDASGMVRIVNSGANVTITDCIVKGKFHATTDNGKKGMGGFVYYQGGTCTLTNCLYIGKNNATSNSDTFAKDATVKNCYYLNACGNEQGEKITEEQLKNGEVAYKLQNGRDTQVWGQELGKDDEPRLTDIVTKYIYKVGFVYKGKEKASRYANRGKAIFGGMPTAQDILGTLYDPAKKYTLIFEYGFNTVTDVYEDRTVAVSILANNNFDIATKDDWKEFRELVSDGHSNLDAKMTADVDLDRNVVLVGNDIVKYSGTFDGQGHTLTVNWNRTSYSIAPFGGVNGATIKNLHVKGQITASGGNLSGLILFADGGKTSVSGCVIDMDLKGSSDVSGMIYKVYGGAQVTITDCVVKGALNSDNTNQIAGFVNYQDYNSSCTLTNCLYAGENNATERSYTFANRANLNNCYYLNACGEAQGEQVTEEQLKSGEVAKLLQADRTDQCYWAQALGELTDLYREADKGKTNYVYHDGSKWVCDDFRLTDGQPLPIGLDFIATKASYERDLSTAAKATICLPYELSVQGFKAYTLSGGNNSAVYFAEAKDKLEAYKPYLITADGTLQLGGTNIQVKAYKADALTTPAGKYSFTGTVVGVSNATAAAANAYILQDDGLFHKVTTEHPGATVPAYRAYVTCPKGSGAKQLSIVIDGETTGIGGATNDARGRADGPVYDLQGRRVADRLDDDARHRLPAGVYIVGGRKVVVK